MAAVRDRVPTTLIQLLAPVPRPSKIWAVGYAYADHRTEVDYDGVAEEPVVFLKAPSSVIGTGEQIRFPKAAPDEVDYEGELAVVIGRRATDVSEAEAYAFVAGFTIATTSAPVTCRRAVSPAGPPMSPPPRASTPSPPWAPPWSRSTSSPTPTTCACAPGSIGELRQDARTSQLIHPVSALVSYLSRQTTLEPGDVISTGTPAGVGHKQGLFLRSGTRCASRSKASAPLSTPALDRPGASERRSSRRNGALTTRFRQATEDMKT